MTHHAKNVHSSCNCLWATAVFSLMTHCTKQKRPHAHVFHGPACTSRKTYLHFPNFLASAVRERDNDPKPRFLDLQREHLVQKKYGNTKRNQTMQHRGEDHSKTNGNRIYLCHSCSDLHLIRKNGENTRPWHES